MLPQESESEAPSGSVTTLGCISLPEPLLDDDQFVRLGQPRELVSEAGEVAERVLVSLDNYDRLDDEWPFRGISDLGSKARMERIAQCNHAGHVRVRRRPGAHPSPHRFAG